MLPRTYLIAAGCFALGIVTATLARSQGTPQNLAAADVPAVEVSRAVLTGPPGRDLRPVAVRVGDDLRSLGRPRETGSALNESVVVYLTVGGCPVQVTLDVPPAGE